MKIDFIFFQVLFIFPKSFTTLVNCQDILFPDEKRGNSSYRKGWILTGTSPLIDNLIRSPINSFVSNLESIVTTIISPTSASDKKEIDAEEDEPKPDCKTYRGADGFCMPLDSCKPLRRRFLSVSRVTMNRIIRHSFCGFTRFIPLICCPDPSGNIFIQQTTSKSF